METFYFLPICGTGMASVAGLLKKAGHRVLGCDVNYYPPMSDLLERNDIQVYRNYDIKHLKDEQIDHVVVGNSLSKGKNIELDYAISQGLSLKSFPEIIEKYLLPGNKSIVVTGTHGKTSTSALLAFLLEFCQLACSFFVGGQLNNFPSSFQYKKESAYFVLEGDEYDTAFFDKEPKFFHYHPDILVINNIEFDHADIFSDISVIKEKFNRLVKNMPSDGIVIANGDDSHVVDVCQSAQCLVRYFTISSNEPIDERIKKDGVFGKGSLLSTTPSMCQILEQEGNVEKTVTLNLATFAHLSNVLAAYTVMRQLKIPIHQIQEGMMLYKGVKRRLEIIGIEAGRTVYDDFAHHPTAVTATIEVLKKSVSGAGRIWAIFEPKSASSRRNIFFDEFSRAFDQADIVIIGKVQHDPRLAQNEKMDGQELVNAIGQKALYMEQNKEIVAYVFEESQPGDHILVMSSGSFDGLQLQLNRLKDKAII